MKVTKEKIAAGFGVPVSKLTVEDVNRANAEAGNYSYMKDTVEPECISMADVINQTIMPYYDEQLFVAHDNCVPENKEYMLKQQESRLKTGVVTINEVRETDGLEPLDGADEPLVPNTYRPLSQIIEPPRPMIMPPSEQPPDEELEEEEGVDEKMIIVGKPEITESYIRIPVRKCKVTATITISKKEGIKALYCGDSKKVATYLFAKSHGWTMAKAKAWIAAHDSGKAITGTVGKMAPEEASSVIVSAVTKWTDEVREIVKHHITTATVASANAIDGSVMWSLVIATGVEQLEPALRPTLLAGAQKAANRMGVSVSPWLPVNPQVQEWSRTYVGRQITLITNETREAIRQAVGKRLSEGMNPGKLSRELREHVVGLNAPQAKASMNRRARLVASGMSDAKIEADMAKYTARQLRQRAEMIARTESAAAYCEGELESYQMEGVRQVEHSAANDACSLCMSLNGKRYSISESRGRLPVHPHCRCDWLPVLE